MGQPNAPSSEGVSTEDEWHLNKAAARAIQATPTDSPPTTTFPSSESTAHPKKPSVIEAESAGPSSEGTSQNADDPPPSYAIRAQTNAVARLKYRRRKLGAFDEQERFRTYRSAELRVEQGKAFKTDAPVHSPPIRDGRHGFYTLYMAIEGEYIARSAEERFYVRDLEDMEMTEVGYRQYTSRPLSNGVVTLEADVKSGDSSSGVQEETRGGGCSTCGDLPDSLRRSHGASSSIHFQGATWHIRVVQVSSAHAPSITTTLDLRIFHDGLDQD